MPENDVIVPSGGNPALDPNKSESGLNPVTLALNAGKQDDPEKLFVGRPRKEADSQKKELEDYWAKRDVNRSKSSEGSKKSRRSGEADEGEAKYNQGGPSYSSPRSISSSLVGGSFASMTFKSPIMREACGGGGYTSIFPLHSHLSQVCGPFRPVTASYNGGMPQSGIQEAIGIGLAINGNG